MFHGAAQLGEVFPHRPLGDEPLLLLKVLRGARGYRSGDAPQGRASVLSPGAASTWHGLGRQADEPTVSLG